MEPFNKLTKPLKFSKLVQLKLDIGASGGEFTPPEVETRGTPTCRSGRLDVG